MNVTINGELMSDYGLTFIHKHIDSPKPKRNTIDVPLTDGIYDLTQAASSVMFYEVRNITMEFEIIKPRCEWTNVQIAVSNAFHGVQAEIGFDDDPDHVWLGFLTVESFEDHTSTGNVTLTLEAQPFRRTKVPIYEETFNVSADTEKIFRLDNKRGYCMIKASNFAELTDMYGNFYKIWPSQVHTDYGIVLTGRINVLDFSVTPSITTTIDMKIYGGDL